MKSFLYIVFLTLLFYPAKAQDCTKNLDEAKRAYYNGQLEEIPTLLEGCLENLDKGDLLDAYKILIYTYLIEGDAEKADEYMVVLLRTEPLYQVQGSDLQEFKNLRNSYVAISKYTVGLTIGPMRPDYQIMRHYSAAGNVDEPADYNEHPGISIGVTGDVRLVDKLYANASLLYDRRSFDQEEIIFGLQRVHSEETQQRLSMPLLLRYVQPIKNWNVFAGGGYGFHYLLKATGDFLHIPLESETPRIDGTPYVAEGVDITEQHKRLTRSWQLACGIQRPFNKYTVELSFSYERGLSNTIDDDNRHFVNSMNENAAYVPDDVRVHAYKINIAFYRTFYKPQRKK